MLRALTRRRGRTALVALVALAGFLMCVLPPHQSQAPTGRISETVSASATAGHSSAASRSGRAARAPSSATGQEEIARSPGVHDHHPAPVPVCQATIAHTMEAVKPLRGAALLIGALLVAAVGPAPRDTRVRAPGWATRPPRLLSGFPLLITLGVSRT
ncbi:MULTISPECIES: hypothetical protein [unclassified Actinopolyspora]|uniref:hypothetical protein n=1 Tax=unclassified Actinopolyspora TaxID=2639451 RepID=UPI0013F5CA20|nr:MULTISPECIES: hypothetical protein [unclassified Actinopolyspora]NHD16278.1 hypothetical protein [Actinopolyspora sp. BKK2]NHE75859.1 hypothetical protein [Actinopolyspora sp. BKK1]